MRVSMRVDYGVRALVDLAERQGDGPVQSADIARRQNIPESYLDQLLVVLHRAGLITSRRGPHGGHTLVANPIEINLGAAVSVLDGSTAMLGCMDDPSECQLSHSCSQRELWQKVEEAVQNVLANTTLAELVARQHALHS